ncbi:M50 family metallopeptidase [Lutispora sp.]|uniref:M50 family metallopeptidase n=1 Tax=Lutispora sp. TaxID=2828727 RepID=UPI002B212186|nr:M50 family metallopeptidase [Lutispora sp.]MEA4960477.1 M50 family metallopeptidase [Lutispora sp.]
MRIKINISFILFLFISIYMGLWQSALVIFMSVLLHELGHSIIARCFKIKVLEIQLFPFGGIAFTENIAKYGGRIELIVALAGPFVSMFVAAAFYFFGEEFFLSSMIIKYNAVLFLFNLIPALPLDGGSIVRNLLLSRNSYKKATRHMTRSGKILAIILTSYNISLLIKGNRTIAYAAAAVFIFAGALKEEKNCSYIYLLNRNNKKKRMLQDFPARQMNVSGETYINSVVDQLSPGNVCKIMVYDEKGNFKKELCEADIMDGFMKYGYYAKIKDIVTKEK